MLHKLLASRNPDDLRAANRLIRDMVRRVSHIILLSSTSADLSPLSLPPLSPLSPPLSPPSLPPPPPLSPPLSPLSLPPLPPPPPPLSHV